MEELGNSVADEEIEEVVKDTPFKRPDVLQNLK